VAVAIKTARELALLPYALRALSTDPNDRRGGGRRGHDRASTRPETPDSEVGSAETDPLQAQPTDESAVSAEEVDPAMEGLETAVSSDSQPSSGTPNASAIS
jgi:hypothetical protein